MQRLTAALRFRLAQVGEVRLHRGRMTNRFRAIGACCVALAISLLLPRSGLGQGAAVKLVFTVQPSTVTAEARISPAVEVTAQDSTGQMASGFTGDVTIAITDGTGNEEAELAGTTTVAAVAGVAVFPDLAIDEIGGGYTLTATAQGIQPATSAAFAITSAVVAMPPPPVAVLAAVHLVFTVQPGSAAEEAVIVPAVQVAAHDSSGALVTGFSGDVTIAITEGTGDPEAELSGTTTVAAVAGVAAFSDLSIDNAAQGYTLTASAPGVSASVSQRFHITAGGAPAPIPVEARERLRSGTAQGAIVLDGRLDEPAWAGADSISNLVTIEPEEGAVPAGQTIVKVLVNARELVFGVLCRDSNPAGIVAFAKTRDFDLELEDHVLIVLDPFLDGRSGYVFAVNPNGARFDGLVTAQGEEVNTDWDAIWEATTARDAGGWSAEIRIPIKSLSFKQGLAEWGFNVQRSVQRLLEISRWAGGNRDYEIFQTSHAGLLTDLPPFDLGLGLSIRPGIVGNANKPAADEDRVYKTEGSLDVTKKVGPNLLSALTINTDFAETEVDARQTNLTRFDLLFPEKRTFFLEGADIFEFGLGTGEDLIAFHSRRIGLQGSEEDLLEIPLGVGGKVNGRVGNTNLGALMVHTRKVDTLPTDATMGVVRIKQNILSESSVGMIATAGDPLGMPGSWMGGADFTYQTSAFQGDKNFLVGAWGLRSHNDEVGGANAFGGMIDYPNDLWDVAVAFKRIDEDFTPSLSFAPRTGVNIAQMEAAYMPRPSWSLVRQMFFEFNPSIVSDLDGAWESYQVETKPLDWQLESGDRFEFSIVPQGDRPTEDFELFGSDETSVVVPADVYRWTRYGVQVAFAPKRRINGEATASTGSFYGGTLNSLELTARLKPSAFLTAELGMERHSAQLPGGNFIQRLYSARVQINVSADLQAASFVQYDNESRSLGTNTRLRWTFDPLGDLFLVFNHNLLRDLNDRFGFDSNQLLIKVQYAYRF
jgi:hypothetical protein